MPIVSADGTIVKSIIGPLFGHTFSMKNRRIFSLLIFFFFVASLAGYIWEVLLTFVLRGEWYNRGFLYGPWLPVYGFGALLFTLLLSSYRSHPVWLFFLSAILGSFLELVTGLALSNYFHMRYWDYSSLPMDLMGYISLLPFLGFGLAGLVWIRYIAPFLTKLWNRFSSISHKLFLFLFLGIFLLDYIVSMIVPNSGRGITF